MGTTNTLDLNNRIDKLEKAVSGGDSAQANKSDIATEFSATTNYTAGCFVYYQGKLYQFNADHSAGAWDPTDVVEANVTDQVVSNAAAIAGLTATDVAYDNTASGLTATDVQGAVDELRQADNIMMSDGVTSVEDALDGKSTVLFKDVNVTIRTTSTGKTIAVNTGVPKNKILSLCPIYNDDMYYFIEVDDFTGFLYTINELGQITLVAPYDKTLQNVAAQRTLVFRVAYLD